MQRVSDQRYFLSQCKSGDSFLRDRNIGSIHFIFPLFPSAYGYEIQNQPINAIFLKQWPQWIFFGPLIAKIQ